MNCNHKQIKLNTKTSNKCHCYISSHMYRKCCIDIQKQHPHIYILLPPHLTTMSHFIVEIEYECNHIQFTIYDDAFFNCSKYFSKNIYIRVLSFFRTILIISIIIWCRVLDYPIWCFSESDQRISQIANQKTNY